MIIYPQNLSKSHCLTLVPKCEASKLWIIPVCFDTACMVQSESHNSGVTTLQKLWGSPTLFEGFLVQLVRNRHTFTFDSKVVGMENSRVSNTKQRLVRKQIEKLKLNFDSGGLLRVRVFFTDDIPTMNV